MPGIRTFLDAGVMITAFQGTSEQALKALALMNDPGREFVASAYLKLELLPQPTWHRRDTEIRFYQTFFSHAAHYISATEDLARDALDQAGTFGLQAMDALHIAAARKCSAEIFVTIEKPEKPIHRIRQPKVVHLSRC